MSPRKSGDVGDLEHLRTGCLALPVTAESPAATLFTGIGELFGHPDGSALVTDCGQIAWIGGAHAAPAADRRVDVGGRAVLPGFVDSHAHLVFAGDRTAEFAARMGGSPYAAGGIRSTVAATRAATDDQLRRNLARLAAELLYAGVTTFECKSGYGLDVATERRSLAIAGEFTTETTFLGAHVVPDDDAPVHDDARVHDDAPGHDGGRARDGGGRERGAQDGGRAQDYVDLVCGEMLDACAPLARWIDVFCERGAFDADQTRTILAAGRRRGLGARVHANQLSHGPGVQLAVEFDAASADHCTHLCAADVDALAGSATVATLLPLAEFSTRSSYPDARRLLDAGSTVALATDCNPGSAYSTAMPLAVALAVREMGMTPAEAVHAATAGGAQALRRDDIGRIAVGMRADLVVLDAPSHVHLAYRPGVPLVAEVWRAGLRLI